jgi:Ca-activated chloride channel family protein
MTFASPFVLLALLAIPVLLSLYRHEQRRRARGAEAFVTRPLTPSVAPRRPRWRRHVPMIAFAVALVLLIVAAARPQDTIAVPVKDGAVMLANDTSSSMAATDVKPTRLAAAEAQGKAFASSVPSSIRVGLLQFAKKVQVLQTPSSDHSLTIAALGQLRTSGGTALGDAIATATRVLSGLRSQNGKRLPGAIVLLSDGASNVGQNSLVAARQAKAQHIPVYTIALGTPSGTIPIRHGGQVQNVPVPPSPQDLAAIASASGGKTFTAADTSGLKTVYEHLAAQLGHKQAKHEITASFAGGGLVLLLLGGIASLIWFGRLI